MSIQPAKVKTDIHPNAGVPALASSTAPRSISVLLGKLTANFYEYTS